MTVLSQCDTVKYYSTLSAHETSLMASTTNIVAIPEIRKNAACKQESTLEPVQDAISGDA